MSEQNTKEQKQMPMKYYASWEIDKSAPYCIPRQCSLKITHLDVKKPLESDLNGVFITIKMQYGGQGTKRTLRTNEINVGPDGLLDLDLDFEFSLQYLHFLKKDGNKLQVMLQRRKKYRNRTILGYKTLAIGHTSMSQALQKDIDAEMFLFSDPKGIKDEVASIKIMSLKSRPIKPSEENVEKLATATADRSPDLESDEDEQADESSNDELTDNEGLLEAGNSRRHRHVPKMRRRTSSRQYNLKQKFIALLKRFKVNEDEVLNSDQDVEAVDIDPNVGEFDELMEELEDLSDSAPEIDTISVISNPKPSLKPFFPRSQETLRHSDINKDCYHGDTSLLLNGEHPGDIPSETERTPDHASPMVHAELSGNESDSAKVNTDQKVTVSMVKPKVKTQTSERRGSSGTNMPLEPTVGPLLLDELASVLLSEEAWLPDSFVLINKADAPSQVLTKCLLDKHLKVIGTCSPVDLKAVVTYLVNRIQKFCKTNSVSPSPVKCVLAGSDVFISSFLKPWVDLFSTKSSEWQQYIKFLIVPIGNCSIGKQLSHFDNFYGSLFYDHQWKDLFESGDMVELANRITRYISSATVVCNLPIAEAMVTCKSKQNDEESSQIFIPFLHEVTVGTQEQLLLADLDEKDITAGYSNTATSPPILLETPPCSPSVSLLSTPSPSSHAGLPSPEVTDLIIDYWTSVKDKPQDGEQKSKKEGNKITLKAIKSLTIYRSLSANDFSMSQNATLTMTVKTREKKKINIRIGKKSRDKEIETKVQTSEGISRLICTSKSQNNPFTVNIDGEEWSSVKFFQISSQWQTHVKYFPVLLSNHTDLHSYSGC